MVCCLRRFRAVFGKRIEVEIGDQTSMVFESRVYLIAFPFAHGDSANPQFASGLRLENLEHKATAAEMSTKCSWMLRNRHLAVVRG